MDKKIKIRDCEVCEGKGLVYLPFGPEDVVPEPCTNCYEPKKELTIKIDFHNLTDIAMEIQRIMGELSALGKQIHLNKDADPIAGIGWEIEEIE